MSEGLLSAILLFVTPGKIAIKRNVSKPVIRGK
jgi:hypothetical protein